MSKFNEVVRLISGSRHLEFSDTNTCVGLMREFLRREALWAGEFSLTDEIPFTDLSVVVSGVRYSDQYLDEIRNFTYSVAENQCCSAMVNWYGWKDSFPPAHETLSLPDPYLPLLHFFRLGGTFTREHRVFIDVNGKKMIQADSIQSGDLSKEFVTLEE